MEDLMTHSTGPAPQVAPPESFVAPAFASGALVLSDGTVFWGRGLGAVGTAVGEICFNTSMTGYQEILTDPSYAGQIITFTFPHVGNIGTNPEDIETKAPAARGLILRADITEPSNWRARQHLDAWLKSHNLVGLCGIDTRALTHHIRDNGAPEGCIAHLPAGVAHPDLPDGHLNVSTLRQRAQAWPGLNGLDLAAEVTCRQSYGWTETNWSLSDGYGQQNHPRFHVVAVDYGAKRNILRCLAQAGCRLTVVPADCDAETILALKPDGIFLSNGPGDPAATGEYAVPIVQQLLESQIPLFGICLGHQILALALGGKTEKMHLGHRGANHPVKDLATGKVEITSQNHGFVVVEESLPASLEVTHRSLFDGSLEGLQVSGKPVFSVQYHPEASPGPNDSHYLFQRFVDAIEASKKSSAAP